jgi:CDP-paratose 2-epimerase
VFGSPEYVVRMNPVGAYHCFELARRDGAQLVSLSTSRVYPYGALGALPHTETAHALRADRPRRDRGGLPARGAADVLRLL